MGVEKLCLNIKELHVTQVFFSPQKVFLHMALQSSRRHSPHVLAATGLRVSGQSFLPFACGQQIYFTAETAVVGPPFRSF